MTPDELRAIMAYLRDRVTLDSASPFGTINLHFAPPTRDQMLQEGLNGDGIEQILTADWWDDMITDIIETPDFCEEDESPEQILEYAKDVVSDYIRKRVAL